MWYMKTLLTSVCINQREQVTGYKVMLNYVHFDPAFAWIFCAGLLKKETFRHP